LIIDSRTSEETAGSSGTRTPSLMPPPSPPVDDPGHLPQDLTERLPIVSYSINDQDAVRRAYILKGPFEPSNSFTSFDSHKVHRLAEFSPNDFLSLDLLRLEMHLDNYIVDRRKEDSYQGINNLVDLSVKLVETNKHNVYDLVYLLLKLVLILPVALESVERAFSMMDFVKNRLRNRMNDGLLDDCLVTFIERDIFLIVKEEDIINYFMAIRRRRPDTK
jgi:hypothetical protein